MPVAYEQIIKQPAGVDLVLAKSTANAVSLVRSGNNKDDIVI
jgi:hypothetical protein